MGFNIETRKVQQTGGSSFIISLPKEWIKKNKIEPKDTLGILSQPDGNLLITPKINSEEYIKSKVFDVDEITNSHYLFRLLIGAYIMGYTIITLKSSKKFAPFMRNTITNFTQIAIGPEIVEESNNFIIVKDLLNPKEMPFEKTIKRMYILVQSMHEDAINALESRNSDLAEEVIKRDNDVDRLHWLVARQSHIVLSDIILCQKMGITLDEASQYKVISRLIERIGDHSVRIAKNAKILIKKEEIEEKLIQSIIAASKISLDLIDNSLDALNLKNIKLANENIEKISELIEACEKIRTKPQTKSIESSIAIGYIIESIRRTGEYCTDINEVIINSLV